MEKIYQVFAVLLNEDVDDLRNLIAEEELLFGFYRNSDKAKQVYQLIQEIPLDNLCQNLQFIQFFFKDCRLTEFYQFKYGLISIEKYRSLS